MFKTLGYLILTLDFGGPSSYSPVSGTRSLVVVFSHGLNRWEREWFNRARREWPGRVLHHPTSTTFSQSSPGAARALPAACRRSPLQERAELLPPWKARAGTPVPCPACCSWCLPRARVSPATQLETQGQACAMWQLAVGRTLPRWTRQVLVTEPFCQW